jgi:hypothetical protein
VTKRAVLAVEGDDEGQLLHRVCLAENIRDHIHLHNLKGRDKLPSKLQALAGDDGFIETVTSLGVVVDAEGEAADRTIKMLCTATRLALVQVARKRSLDPEGVVTPELTHGACWRDPLTGLRVGAFVAPDGVRPGMLEDLCLDAAAEGPATKGHPPPRDVLACVDAYLQCLADRNVPRPDWPKRRLYAYLAAQEEPGRRLAQAWDAGYWPPDSACWQPLEDFLKELAGG